MRILPDHGGPAVRWIDERKLAAEQDFTDGTSIKEGVKAGDSVTWLKHDFALGHGHAMVMYALLKDTKSEDSQ